MWCICFVVYASKDNKQNHTTLGQDTVLPTKLNVFITKLLLIIGHNSPRFTCLHPSCVHSWGAWPNGIWFPFTILTNSSKFDVSGLWSKIHNLNSSHLIVHSGLCEGLAECFEQRKKLAECVLGVTTACMGIHQTRVQWWSLARA